MQQRLNRQGRRRGLVQARITGVARAEHRADAFAGQLMYLHVRRPGRLGENQQGIQPWPPWVQIAFAGGQVQAQVRQVGIQPAQARNQPTRQQAAGTTEDERRIGAALSELGTNIPQPLEGLTAGVPQANPGICEFNATSILAEKAQPQVFLKHLQLPADRTVGDMQLLGGLADAVQPGGGFEGPQGIQGAGRGSFDL